MLVLPFAGFTERVPSASNNFRSYEIAGIGTYGEDLNVFEFPASVWVIQYAVMLLAVALVYPLLGAWRSYRDGASGSDPRRAARISGGIAAAFVVLVLVTMFAVFPAVEDELIWNTDVSGGWLDDWWPAYGAFITVAALAAMTALLARPAKQPAATPQQQAVTPSPVPPGWHPDPTQRHELRFWDGTQWTQNVSDAGQASVDTM